MLYGQDQQYAYVFVHSKQVCRYYEGAITSVSPVKLVKKKIEII